MDNCGRFLPENDLENGESGMWRGAGAGIRPNLML